MTQFPFNFLSPQGEKKILGSEIFFVSEENFWETEFLYLREGLIRTTLPIYVLHFVFCVVICDSHFALWSGKFWFCSTGSPLGQILSNWKDLAMDL